MTAPSPAPRVSIVIPAFNSARYLGFTLDSVLAQTLTSWELVVYDDGSTDGTGSIARTYADRDPRIRVVCGPNRGVAEARNRGLAATDPRTEFVIFLDNDDIWEPDALESLVAMLDSHEEYVSAHALARCIDKDGEQPPGDDVEEWMRARHGFRGSAGRLAPVPAHEPTTFADLACRNWVLTPGLQLIRRGVLACIGGFDPETVPADDWDMAVRVSRVGDLGFVERPLLHWRRHVDAQSQLSTQWRRAYFRVRTKMMIDPTNTPEQRQAARLSYRRVNSGALHDARHELMSRHPSRAAREAARAVYGWANYLAAAGSLRRNRRRG